MSGGSPGFVQASLLDCPQVIADAFELLKEKNKNVSSIGCYNHFIKNSGLRNKVFKICQEYGLDPEVRYSSVELFNCFNQSLYPDEKHRIEKFCPHGAKYMMVCITLCCKIAGNSISHSNVLKEIKKMCGQEFGKEEITTAEYFVLQTVDYELNFMTSLDFLDILLYYIQILLKDGWTHLLPDFPDLAKNCLHVQDMVYIRRTKVFSKCDNYLYPDVQCDRLLIAVAIVCVSCFLMDGQLGDIVAKYLKEKCELEHKTVKFVSLCIMGALVCRHGSGLQALQHCTICLVDLSLIKT